MKEVLFSKSNIKKIIIGEYLVRIDWYLFIFSSCPFLPIYSGGINCTFLRVHEQFAKDHSDGVGKLSRQFKFETVYINPTAES